MKSPPTDHNPWEYANCLSRTFFCWIFPLFRKGYKNYIKTDDLYQVPNQDGAEILANKLESEWNKELDKHKEGKEKKPRLYRAIIRAFRKSMILWVLVAFTQGCCSILQCILLQQLIRYFDPDSGITTMEAYLYAAGLTACVAGVVLLTHPEAFGLAHIGMRIRVACSTLIYKKSLKLNHIAIQEVNSGHVINLLANDVYRFDTVLSFLNCLWTGPLMIVVVYVLVFEEFGIYALAPLILTLVMIPIQIGIGRCEAYIRNHTVGHTDDRVKCLSEIITGMRDIKMHTWEKPFTNKVQTIRSQEMKRLAQSSTLQSIVFFMYCSWGLLSGFCTFLPYVLNGNLLRADSVFYVLALYDLLREYTFYDYPTALQYMFETTVSLRRIKKFLMLEEWERLDRGPKSPEHKPGTIIVKSLTASWTKSTENQPVLQDITFDVKPGELIAVIGPVGSGKTTLLRALMNDLTQHREELVVEGAISHASQQPWVFKDTFKRNIILFNSFDEQKYNKVIEVCNLVHDVSRLVDGHNTALGEKGEGLSGGQKARVNLARAVYHDADIYLLEDPFSALDYKIARDIMDNCICGYLKGKTRILVTHQTQYLDSVDKVLVLQEGGIRGFGTLKEIKESGIDCADVIRQVQEDKEKRIQAKKRWNRIAFTLKTAGAFKQNVAPQKVNNWKKLMRTRTATSAFGKGHFMKLRSSYLSEGDYLSEEYLKEVKARKAAQKDSEVDGTVEEEGEEEEEEVEEGEVGFGVYLQFFRAGYGILGSIVVMLICLSTQALYVGTDWILSVWCDSNEAALESTDGNDTAETFYAYNTSDVSGNGSLPFQPTDSYDSLLETNIDYLFLYTLLVAASLLFGLVRSVSLFLGAINASRNLHYHMFRAIMRTYIAFFDVNSTGRILNRFSKDVGVMDDMLPFSLVDFIQHSLILLGILCVVLVVNQWVLAVTVPLVVVFIILRRFYLKTSNSVKRLEGTTRSPVFSQVTTTLKGLWTIRPANVEAMMEKQFFRHQDKHTSAWFLFLATIRWFALCLDWLVVVFIAAVAFSCVVAAESLDAGFVGLSLQYSLNLIGVFQWCVRASADVESHMIAVERVIEYNDLKSEAYGANVPDEDWPPEGAISFKDVSYSYTEDSPPKLKNVTFNIQPREKIGIVGRSGAGKSTIIEALLLMSKPQGTITIDNEHTGNIDLSVLRNKIAVIPQVPMLFSGTLRMNLDPFDEFDDEKLWKVIEQVDLRDMVEAMEGGFDGELCEGGSNLSVGQRQLVCLARAILQETRVLVIDEATANVDATTDQMIQRTIKKQFKDCTVLTIAHRLNTVIDCDKIMVVHDGTVAEFDEPYKLLKKEDGHFRKMVTASKGTKLKLEKLAKLRKEEKQKSKRQKIRRLSDVTFDREQNGDLNVRIKTKGSKAPLASDTEL